MKKILIMSHALEIGGAESSLLGLLENIDTKKYEVDLFLMRHSGELIQYIPPTVHLLPEIPQYASLAIPISKVIKQGYIGIAIGRVIGKCKARVRTKKLGFLADNAVSLEYSHKYTKNVMPKISDTKYDFAISFLTPHYFLAEKIDAKKKMAWIHTDYSIVKVDIESELKMWSKYDYIASISENVSESFLKIFPSLKERVVLIENILPIHYMKELRNAFSTEQEMPSDGSLKLLSIGRFSSAKKFEEIPAICKRIRDNGINVKWYLIGYGGEEDLIRRKILEEHMEEFVIILGKKENPYPYIKACDIYLQPSRYEGKSVAVREAQSLNKPVIITNYQTAQSQLKDGYDGIIVPLDIQGCAEGIIEVICNKELQQKLIENTLKNDYTNVNEIDKLYRLIEDKNDNEKSKCCCSSV